MQKFAILLIFALEFTIIAEKNEKEEDPEATTAVVTDSSIAVGESFSKCYGEIGCVHTDETWFDKNLRPVNLKPFDRNVIKTEFILIRKNHTKAANNGIFYQVVTTTKSSLENAGYSPGIFLFVLIHDFTSNGYTGWIKHIAKVLKSRTRKCNIISVDWHIGAQPVYDQAIANARVVGLEVIHLLKFLKENYNLTLDYVHLIGHGVGAHIAGYVGYSFKAFKITGLDPSGPRFDGMPYNVRLDASDAVYVEVLHTDAIDKNYQGAKSLFGHTDFFINNADRQPGCTRKQTTYDLISVNRATLSQGEVLPGCSHKRAYKYYIESLEAEEECTFLGIKCESYSAFLKGKCTDCEKNCRTFGLVTYSQSNNGSYFLQTGARRPYCLFQYQVTMIIKGTKSSYSGSFQFILTDKNYYTTISSRLEPREFKPGKENNFVFYAGVPRLGKIIHAEVGWIEEPKRFCIINCKYAIDVDKVTIQLLNTKKNTQKVTLCTKDDESEIQSGEYQVFVPCKTVNQKNKET